MSSGEVFGVMRPGGRLVGCAGFEAAVEDADQAVGELAPRTTSHQIGRYKACATSPRKAVTPCPSKARRQPSRDSTSFVLALRAAGAAR